jgi:hypothetical protein
MGTTSVFDQIDYKKNSGVTPPEFQHFSFGTTDCQLLIIAQLRKNDGSGSFDESKKPINQAIFNKERKRIFKKATCQPFLLI